MDNQQRLLSNDAKDNGEKNESPKTNLKIITNIGLVILILGFGAFFVWASVAPLDEGVVCIGQLTVLSKNFTIQHQYGGTVSNVAVKEGERVKKGQTLIMLNDKQAIAHLTEIDIEYLTYLAIESRLLSERKLLSSLVFPQEIRSRMHIPQIAQIVSSQEELFIIRHRALQDEKRIIQENLEGLKEQIKRLEELEGSLTEQIKYTEKQLIPLKSLADDGYYPKNKIFEMQRTLSELSGRRSETLGNIARSKKTAIEYSIRLVRIEQDFIKEVENQLSDTKKKLTSLKDQRKAAQDILNKTIITAPVDGTIVGLTVHNVGSVISPGQKIMDIVPHGADLIIEAKVMPKDIERVKAGLKADLRFTVLDNKKTPTVEGEVFTVSADSLIDEMNRFHYYLIKVKLTPKGMQKLSEYSLQPGMPVDVIIKTGERTFMEYLIKPLLDRMALSLKEK